jgi:hypothetical protein
VPGRVRYPGGVEESQVGSDFLVRHARYGVVAEEVVVGELGPGQRWRSVLRHVRVSAIMARAGHRAEGREPLWRSSGGKIRCPARAALSLRPKHVPAPRSCQAPLDKPAPADIECGYGRDTAGSPDPRDRGRRDLLPDARDSADGARRWEAGGRQQRKGHACRVRPNRRNLRLRAQLRARARGLRRLLGRPPRRRLRRVRRPRNPAPRSGRRLCCWRIAPGVLCITPRGER